MAPIIKRLLIASVVTCVAVAAAAAVNRVSVKVSAGERCIASNGIPDHAVGQFPNRGNPHRIKAQSTKVCVTTMPQKGDQAQSVRVTGVAKNGILIRPGTADYYDASSRRGHSRDRSSGWNLEAMGSDMLGLDQNNAHVDNRGLYHYHGMPEALTVGEGTLVGWAADGFEIHYVGAQVQASYMLKPGTRSSAPGGAHDGTYVQDWQYVANLSGLDQCNGAQVNGRYVYFATDSFPFFPRCLYGTDVTRIR